MKKLERKTVLITGGASGIGFACVEKFLREGACVMLIDKDEKALEIARCSLADSGHSIKICRLDISQDDDRRSAIDQMIEWRGSCDVLINCAASFVMKGVDAELSDWSEVFDVNVVACARLAHWMAQRARFAQLDRSIVNICSISATHAQPNFATYNASKGALLTLTKCMALDLAPFGIRVNSVSPGTIWTASNAQHILNRFGVDRTGADKHPELGGRHVLRRLGDPFEVANAVAFLASNEASFITGANLMVDGGYSII